MIEFEQDHDIELVLHKPLRLFDDHFGDLHMPGGRLVEGRADDLAAHGALHVRHLFGTLIDKQHDEIALGVIGGDGVGYILEKNGLAGAGRRDDQSALALAQWRDDVDDARAQILRTRLIGLHFQPGIRVERRQIVEVDLVADFFGVVEIDLVDLQKREIALAVFRPTDLPLDRIAGSKRKPADLARAHINVVRSWKVVRVRGAQKAKAVLENFDDAVSCDFNFPSGELLQDGEHQLLFAERARILDSKLFGDSKKLRRRLHFKILKFHFLHDEDDFREVRNLAPGKPAGRMK